MKGFLQMIEESGYTTLGILVIMVLIIGITIPFLLRLTESSCYASAWTNLGDLGSDMRSSIRNEASPPLRFSLGLSNCIKGVVFVNREDEQYSDIIKNYCKGHESYVAYIIGIPYDEDTEPICKNLEHGITSGGQTAIPLGYPEKTNKGEVYCLKIDAVGIAGQSDFNYMINLESCTAEEQEKNKADANK